MKSMNPKEMANELSNFVNTFSVDSKVEELAEELANDHRTLQQNHMRLALAIIERFAKKKHTDGRNEHSVKIAKVLFKAYKEHLGYDEDDEVNGIHNLPHV